MNLIEVTCCNDGCKNKFRVPEFSRPNSTIKTKTDNQECRICKNKKLLEQSTFKTKGKSAPSSKQKNKGNGKKKGKSTCTIKKLNKKLDDAWSKLIKLRAGYKCEVCKTRRALNSHHIYSRAKMSVRWDEMNGICLCVNHHIGIDFSAHKTPYDFNEWLKMHRGEEFMKQLRFKANQTAYSDRFAKEILLKELNKEIDSLT